MLVPERRLTMRHQVDYTEALAQLMREATTSRSQRQLARGAGVSQGTIGNMVLGRVPSRDVCLRVAQAAGIPATRLLQAAGYDTDADPVAAVEWGLRCTNIPDEGKEQIKRFVEKIAEKYKPKPEGDA
jgi:transcriptional regulator with XRE-family HTH domain